MVTEVSAPGMQRGGGRTRHGSGRGLENRSRYGAERASRVNIAGNVCHSVRLGGPLQRWAPAVGLHRPRTKHVCPGDKEVPESGF